MTSDIDRRQPQSCAKAQRAITAQSDKYAKCANVANRKPTTHLTIMRIIRKDLKPWIIKSEAVFLQNRSRYKQLVYKNHSKFRNPGETSVWKRRSYISSEVVN